VARLDAGYEFSKPRISNRPKRVSKKEGKRDNANWAQRETGGDGNYCETTETGMGCERYRKDF
jgi:hypothetical protein